MQSAYTLRERAQGISHPPTWSGAVRRALIAALELREPDADLALGGLVGI
jgi:hypothetical protein